MGVTRCGIAMVSPLYQLSPWIRQLEVDVGLCADTALDMASDQEVWRAQRSVAGQAVQ